MRRRHFLALSASTLGGVLVYSLDRKAMLLSPGQKPLRIPLRFFTGEEALIVAAAASRIFPNDDSGPGACEAGVAIYIDRQLAGPYGRDRYRYTQEPFEEAAPEFGYQGKPTPREVYKEGLKSLKGLARLSTNEQDKSLQQIESSRFFLLLRQHTIEGMFSDPLHGGNKDMIGWQLIGFPGSRMSYYDDIDTHYGEAFRPKPVSLAKVTGSRIRPSEEKK